MCSLFTFTLFTASATRFHHYVLPVLPGLAALLALGLDALLEEGLSRHRPALLVGAVLQALVWKDLWLRPRHLLDLFTYNHERPYPDVVLLSPVSFKAVLLVSVGLLGAALGAAVLRERPRWFASALAGFAALVAVALSWQHWPALGRHWTQRELTATWHAHRKGGEPLGAFLMNWKGETFYSRNEVVQVSARDPRGELASLALRPGPAYLVVEHARLPVMRGALPPGQRVEVLAPETMNKFVLVRVDE